MTKGVNMYGEWDEMPLPQPNPQPKTQPEPHPIEGGNPWQPKTDPR